MGGATKDIFEVSWLMDYSNRSVCVNEQETKKGDTKRGCQHPSNKFEILWQFAQNSFFSPTFIFCCPICSNNCGVVFLRKYILVFEK